MKALTTLAVLGASLFFLSGCGNTNSNPAPGQYPQYGYNNTCQAGSVNTQYGCLPQGNCQFGFAMYNNSCIPAVQQQFNQNVQCPSGQFNTQFGCRTQGNCQYGYASYNNSCIPVVNNNINNNCISNTNNNTYSNTGNYGGFNYGINYNYGYGTNCNTGIQNTNSCQPGYYSTNYGCLPQANCGQGMVLYQNTCRSLYQSAYGASFQFMINL
jgi:hypothetical protein